MLLLLKLLFLKNDIDKFRTIFPENSYYVRIRCCIVFNFVVMIRW